MNANVNQEVTRAALERFFPDHYANVPRATVAQIIAGEAVASVEFSGAAKMDPAALVEVIKAAVELIAAAIALWQAIAPRKSAREIAEELRANAQLNKATGRLTQDELISLVEYVRKD